MHALNQKRSGKFKVSAAIVRDHPEAMLKVMAEVIILRAEYLFMRDLFEYSAWSPKFELCADCCESPEYRPLFELVDDKAEFIGFEKIQPTT
jgi:hypothetical protein